MTWFEGKDHCEGGGGKLVEIDSDEENIALVDVDLVDMDMVNRKFLVNFIYLGSLPRIISRTCLDSLVLLNVKFK